MNHLIAIDPGVSGGVACLINGEVKCWKMPETQGDMVDLLRELRTRVLTGHDELTCYIEDLPRYVGENVPSSAIGVMFENFGVWLGALLAFGIRTIKVTPQRWQKALNLGTKGLTKAPPGAGIEQRAAIKRQNEQAKRDWKTKLRGEAQRRFPHLAATLKTADSLLILEYGKQADGMREVEQATPYALKG